MDEFDVNKDVGVGVVDSLAPSKRLKWKAC